ncbi:hypothetical protein IMG5_136970 [Ichthyophthirius multifiliis]|uniref:Uncharacterized protein n=1 Tax=Ichthyophthirius multifiliis TaxID=5932 RepID=G0QX08_ICHMU|nr:hypothetical protein IMG5_136970 [Ichthyophthirius multifiliis]EGR30243.1 hypothetical protein IMG5_136970 [Ichthyophthirius multifiliis]|eukprot:XP_004031839.1 hypothetical protein IMG5_136970 [Ichthyophthirius multifiliis]
MSKIPKKQIQQKTSFFTEKSSKKDIEDEEDEENEKNMLKKLKKNKEKKSKKILQSDSDSDQMNNEQTRIFIKKKKVEEQKMPQEETQISANNYKNDSRKIIYVPPLNINMKWNQLRNSNCSHEEYQKWEESLKKSEAFDIKDIKETIIQRLVNCKIKGFQSKEQLLQKGIQEIIEQNPQINDIEYELDEASLEEFRNDQFNLLEKLMSENNLIATDLLSQNNLQNIENLDQAIIEIEENYYNSKNSVQKQFEIYEKEENSIKKYTQDCSLITMRVKSLLLDIKSDELFTDSIENTDKLDEQTTFQLVELTAYIMNNVHYFQKFNLKCDLLHPLDLQYVIDKFLNNIQKQNK